MVDSTTQSPNKISSTIAKSLNFIMSHYIISTLKSSATSKKNATSIVHTSMGVEQSATFSRVFRLPINTKNTLT